MADYTSDYEKAEEFRQKALEQGLIYGPYFRVRGRKFYFDLNYQAISLSQEPEKIVELIRLARQSAVNNDCGEHNDILQLVAQKSDLEKDMVNWYRVHHTCAYKHPELYISLEDWLKEKGFDAKTIFPI